MRCALCIAAALCIIAGAQAQAHAFLVKAEPPVGATIGHAPMLLRLEFSEPLELGFSGIDVTSASGSALALDGLRFADGGHKVLIAGLPMLAPGAYRVRWHVVSVDTHRTEGEFTFTVKP